MKQVKHHSDLILKTPPVVETAITLQFSELTNWKALHHGLFYELVRNEFPAYEHRPDEPPLIMPFPLQPNFRTLQLSRDVGPGRAEYATESGTTLVAVQNNRFSFHWKKSEDGTYPSYASNREMCKSTFQTFVDFCRQEEIGDVQPVLCESMYLNRIFPSEGESLADLCERVFSTSVGDFEALTINRTYVLGDNDGRLYSEINAWLIERPHLTLKLSSRVRHEKESDAMETLDSSHDWLIQKFKQLTNDQERRSRWGEQ